MSNSWYENEDHRKLSIESEDQGALAVGIRKISKKRSRILSVDNGSPFGSVASNLNRTSQGPLEVCVWLAVLFKKVRPRFLQSNEW